MTESIAPPSYNEALLQRKLSELGIGEQNTVTNNAQINDNITELSPSATDEGVITNVKRKPEDVYNSNEQQAAQNNTPPITVGRVLLIGLLLIVSPWCACKMMQSTPQQNKNVQGCRSTRSSGCCGGSVDRMERRGERQIARLERRIERKTEKMDRKEARDKLCNRKREKYERKIHR